MFSFLVGFWCFWDFEMFFDWIFSGFQAMVLPQSCGNFYGKSRLSAEKRQLYFLWFSERSRHLIGTDVKEILEIPCQCWILQNSFSFLITRRSRGSNPVSATKSKAVHMDCFFRCHRVMSPKKRGKIRFL